MGIGNTCSADSSSSLRTVSLPLMGIGNCSTSPSPRRTATAHYPSWGSETAGGKAELPPRADLITPHGDRKLVWRRRIVVVRHELSLPLMGIGNRPCLADGGGQEEHSLPLMGIGNCRRAARIARSLGSHYPSWGSETPVGGRRRRPVDALITPHGDRKQGSGGLHCEQYLVLITPHGDRKRAMPRRARALLLLSLPLMGIGN